MGVDVDVDKWQCVSYIYVYVHVCMHLYVLTRIPTCICDRAYFGEYCSLHRSCIDPA